MIGERHYTGFDMLKLVDSHLHLQDYDVGTDIASMVENASAVGVSYMVCNGTSVESWPIVRGFAETYPQVIPCFGLHPWFIPGRSQEWLPILESFVESMPSGVGEIGLDRLREPCDKSLQEEAFRVQLDIARRYERPAMIHCVRAWGWLTDILRSESELPCGMLIHSYGGSVDLIEPLTGMGAYFSFSGKVLYTNYERARKSLLAVPPDRLLIETDAPCMLPPEQYRVGTIRASDGGEYNLPVNLPSILGGIAELLGESPESLSERLWQNSQRFFEKILR